MSPTTPPVARSSSTTRYRTAAPAEPGPEAPPHPRGIGPPHSPRQIRAHPRSDHPPPCAASSASGSPDEAIRLAEPPTAWERTIACSSMSRRAFPGEALDLLDAAQEG